MRSTKVPRTARTHLVRLQATTLAISLAIATTACGGTSTLAGGPALTTCTPTEAAVQEQILRPSCGGAGCHAGTSPAMGLDLTSAGLQQRIVAAPAAGCGDQTLIVARDPDRSYLVAKVTQAAPACGEQMPLGHAPLSGDQLSCLRGWVAAMPAITTAPDGGDDAWPDSGTLPGPVDAGPVCTGGQVVCAGACVDLSSNNGNCGACARTCASGLCSAGQCVTSCPGGTTSCSGACVDLAKSALNCSACGKSCAQGQTCASGVCTCGSSVSFATQVQPVFTASCTSGCHSGVRPAAGMSLVAGSSFGALVRVASSSCSSRLRVAPGAVAQSYLINKLTGGDLCSGSQMPKAGGALPAAQITAITTWICNGAPNN
jgi:hypothetical protein